jgi:monoamine oxidase
MNQHLKQMLDTVTSVPALKLFLLYEQRWWEKLATGGIVQGRSICDLPIRQTYYFKPDACEQGSCRDYGLLMASYDDAHMVDYWKGLEDSQERNIRSQNELSQRLTALPTSFSGRRGTTANKVQTPPPNLSQAPEIMIQHARQQLALLHGINVQDIPEALIGVSIDWSSDPLGGAWHLWKPQVDVEQIMRRIKQPLGDQHKIYIIGEAYSGMQAWVEGALTATEVVLQQKFRLKRPAWLPADYYLGW